MPHLQLVSSCFTRKHSVKTSDAKSTRKFGRTIYDLNYLDGKWERTLRPRHREKWIPNQQAYRIGRSLKNLVIRPMDKRINRFQQIFGKVFGKKDQLIAAYSCAFRSDVIAQGHLYVSQRNISFYSSSLKWETRFIIPLSKITKISKEKTEKVFPNALVIETCDDEKYFFTSFTQRDKSFTLLLYVWQSSIDGANIVPDDLWKLRSTPEGHLDTSSKESCINSTWAISPKVSRRMPHSISSSKSSTSKMTELMIGYSSTDSVPNNCACLVSSECADMLNESSDDMSNMSEGEFDSKVSCRCKSHFGKVLLDDVFRLPTEQLFTILFSSMPWYDQLSDIVKTTAQSRLFESISDYSASPWITDRTKATISTRTATYTMALNHAMAPKSTTVTEKQVCAEFDRLSDGFVVTKESQNAGIPYADSFLIQCTYCITRIGSVHSRLRIHGGIIYKKSIWGIVKGYIEKSTYAGLEDHYTALDEALKIYCEQNAAKTSLHSFDDNTSTQHPNVDNQSADRRSILMNRVKGQQHNGTHMIGSHSMVDNNPSLSRDLRTRLRNTLTEEAQTQTLPVIATTDLSYYAKLIITLLTTLILLHAFTLMKLSLTDVPQRCNVDNHFMDAFIGNSDSSAIAELMRFGSSAEIPQDTSELRQTIDRVHTELAHVRQLWQRANDPS